MASTNTIRKPEAMLYTADLQKARIRLPMSRDFSQRTGMQSVLFRLIQKRWLLSFRRQRIRASRLSHTRRLPWTQVDVEAFQNADYGENFMKELGELTGGKGKYIQFVGALTSVSHNEWCDAAKALQEKEYPDMECLGRYETGDDTTSSYNQTKELLTANPDITAIEGSASTDVVGAAQAVEELGLAGKVAIVGTSMTSIAQQYVEDGTIASFSVWDPAEAGKAMICMAIAELDGTVDDSTMHLAAKGYETVENVNKDGVYYGNARVDVTKDNMNDYNF